MRAVSVVEVTLFMLAVVTTQVECNSKCHLACKHMIQYTLYTIQYNTRYPTLFRFGGIQSNNYDI